MSDANGLATWKIPNSFKSAIAWKYDGTNIKISNNILLYFIDFKLKKTKSIGRFQDQAARPAG